MMRVKCNRYNAAMEHTVIPRSTERICCESYFAQKQFILLSVSLPPLSPFFPPLSLSLPMLHKFLNGEYRRA